MAFPDNQKFLLKISNIQIQSSLDWTSPPVAQNYHSCTILYFLLPMDTASHISISKPQKIKILQSRNLKKYKAGRVGTIKQHGDEHDVRYVDYFIKNCL